MTPAVPYPDPDKDPTREAGVQALWVEFEEALRSAGRILICGHSLNDPVLVETLKVHTAHTRIAVAVDFHHDYDAVAGAVQEKLPGAAVVEMHVAREVGVGPRFHEWLHPPVTLETSGA
jgi:hypothetical protein